MKNSHTTSREDILRFDTNQMIPKGQIVIVNILTILEDIIPLKRIMQFLKKLFDCKPNFHFSKQYLTLLMESKISHNFGVLSFEDSNEFFSDGGNNSQFLSKECLMEDIKICPALS